MPTNSTSLQNMLSSVLAVFNTEQCQSYPPAIYQAHYRTVTSFLLSKLSEIYPNSQDAIDMIDPFVEQELIPVTNGYIQLPDNYRNLLGSPSIAAKQDGSGECSDLPVTATDFKITVEKRKCKKNPLVIVPEAEFADRTRSTYDFPTYENPIGYFIGKKQIKVCPYDISKVLVIYARNEKEILVKYIMQPDDTYLIDENGSTNPEWNSNAFTPIFKGICALYSAYSRDPNLKQWSDILNQIGLV